MIKNIKIYTFLFLMLLLGSILSCSNDERDLTSAELIAREMKDVIDEYEVQDFRVYESGEHSFDASDCEFSGPFISLSGWWFNLENLDKYGYDIHCDCMYIHFLSNSR